MKRWLNTALALVLMLAIAAGGFFLPNFVSARLDRRNQDAEFPLSTGDEQSPATVLRLKLTDGIQNLFYNSFYISRIHFHCLYLRYLIHKLSVITQRLLFVKLLALVSPSPVLLAIVNVQKPSPPNPSAA